MKRLLTTKGIGIMAAVALILAVGAAYVAAQGVFDKNVTASWSVQISGDAIQVYEADGTTVVNAIDFGTSFTDFFGNIPQPTHKVVVKNLSATAVQVFVTGDGGDGIIPLFGPTTGDLKPQPDNLFLLQPQGQTGDMTMGLVGLNLPQLVSGSKTTTIIFRATEVGAGIQPPTGMVGWWPGDGNTIDVVGGNAGVLSGNASFTGGMVGQAFSFDGTGDSVFVGHDPSLDLNQFTFDAWVKPGRLPEGIFQAIITKNINPRPPSLWLSEDKVQVWFGPGSTLRATSVTGLTLDTWHHLAATYDGSDVKIYIDGALDISVPVAVTPATNTQPLRFAVARDGVGASFQGLIDEVEIFNRALSAAEVRAIFDAGSAGKVKPAFVPTHKVVVPNAQTDAEGNADTSFPLNIVSVGLSAQRYQQVYASGDIGGTGIIDKIAFRPDANLGVAFTAEGVSIDIRLSHTPSGPDSLSSTYANNVGPDETVVLDTDSLAYSSAKANCGPSGPCDFDIIIDLNDVFTFNGTDNLLLDIRLRTGDANANGFFDLEFSIGDGVGRVFNNTSNLTASNGTAQSAGIVTKFFLRNFTPSPSSVSFGGSPAPLVEAEGLVPGAADAP